MTEIYLRDSGAIPPTAPPMRYRCEHFPERHEIPHGCEDELSFKLQTPTTGIGAFYGKLKDGLSDAEFLRRTADEDSPSTPEPTPPSKQSSIMSAGGVARQSSGCMRCGKALLACPISGTNLVAHVCFNGNCANVAVYVPGLAMRLAELTASGLPAEPPTLEERYWCGCVRYARWARCGQHGELDHDDEPDRGQEPCASCGEWKDHYVHGDHPHDITRATVDGLTPHSFTREPGRLPTGAPDSATVTPESYSIPKEGRFSDAAMQSILRSQIATHHTDDGVLRFSGRALTQLADDFDSLRSRVEELATIEKWARERDRLESAQFAAPPTEKLGFMDQLQCAKDMLHAALRADAPEGS